MSETTRQHIEEELHELWKPEKQGKTTDILWFQRNYTTNLVIYAPTLDFCREVATWRPALKFWSTSMA
ncbi:MAG: hypothetical protein P8130_15055 [Deltaproteobacteria bacterium]